MLGVRCLFLFKSNDSSSALRLHLFTLLFRVAFPLFFVLLFFIVHLLVYTVLFIAEHFSLLASLLNSSIAWMCMVYVFSQWRLFYLLHFSIFIANKIPFYCSWNLWRKPPPPPPRVHIDKHMKKSITVDLKPILLRWVFFLFFL